MRAKPIPPDDAGSPLGGLPLPISAFLSMFRQIRGEAKEKAVRAFEKPEGTARLPC
jgi:hypothetical protein